MASSVMTRGRHVGLLAASIAAVVLAANAAWGRRAPPAPVAPARYQGVRYEAPPFNNPCEQNGGCVVAFDDATGAELWSLKVYCTKYDPGLETDVQDVFITSLVVNQGQLAVTNEKSFRFTVDLATREVSGDARGCQEASTGSCSHSPASPGSPRALAGYVILGLLVLVRRRLGLTQHV